jgi:multidrug efflux pump subunit AcrA (membrane-fusion protein)
VGDDDGAGNASASEDPDANLSPSDGVTPTAGQGFQGQAESKRGEEPTAPVPLGGPEDPSRAFHSHSLAIAAGTTPPHHPSNTRRQLVFAVIVVLLLGAAAVLTIMHFSHPSNELQGVVQPSEELSLNFQNVGTIEHIDVQPGEHVRAGQTLATQDASSVQITIAADYAQVLADQAKLASDEAANGDNEALEGQSATVSNDQGALALQTAQQNVDAASSTLQMDQQRLSDAAAAETRDQQAEGTDCTLANATGPTCTQAKDLVATDQNNVSLDTLSVQADQKTVSDLTNVVNETSALDSSQTALSQGRLAISTSPVAEAAQISADVAVVASDHARITAEKQSLTQFTLVAPVAGVISSVGGEPGELASSDGVRTFSGASGENQPSSSFNLFPSQPSSSQVNSAVMSPLIQMYSTTQWDVVAEASENQVSAIQPGEPVTVQVSSLSGSWFRGTVSYVEGTPVSAGDSQVAATSATYNVWIKLRTMPAGILPGMTTLVLPQATDQDGGK